MHVNFWCYPEHYRMKIYTEFNLATWLRLVKFTELNIGKFWLLNFNYIGYHWEISKNKIISKSKFSNFAISEIAKLKSHWKFSSCRVHVVLLLYVVAYTVMNVTSLLYFYCRTTLQEDNILPLLDVKLKPDDDTMKMTDNYRQDLIT